jgi:hypothetical protein
MTAEQGLALEMRRHHDHLEMRFRSGRHAMHMAFVDDLKLDRVQGGAQLGLDVALHNHGIFQAMAWIAPFSYRCAGAVQQIFRDSASKLGCKKIMLNNL